MSDTGIERIVGTYSGEGHDLDVVFWNVEWFTNCFQEKAGSLAEVIVDLNADVWALLDCSIDATRALIDQLRQDYDLDFGCAFAEPNASAGARSTSVIWNMATTVGERLSWPDEIDEWFQVDSQQFGDLRLEAAHGRVFERYPGFFRVQAANRPGDADPFELLLVPLQLLATQEGTARRRLAARILAAAVMKEIARGETRDWIIGGEYAADLATQEFRAMIRDGLVPLSAAEIGPGAMSYLKSAKSLIDHIFLSRNLVRTFGADDFFVSAGDRELPEYIGDLSDRLPVLLRLSLSKTLPKAASLPPSLASALGLA